MMGGVCTCAFLGPRHARSIDHTTTMARNQPNASLSGAISIEPPRSMPRGARSRRLLWEAEWANPDRRPLPKTLTPGCLRIGARPRGAGVARALARFVSQCQGEIDYIFGGASARNAHDALEDAVERGRIMRPGIFDNRSVRSPETAGLLGRQMPDRQGHIFFEDGIVPQHRPYALDEEVCRVRLIVPVFVDDAEEMRLFEIAACAGLRHVAPCP